MVRMRCFKWKVYCVRNEMRCSEKLEKTQKKNGTSWQKEVF